MSFKMNFSRSRRSILAYSILAVSLVAALSSVGAVFAQASTTTTSTSSQTSNGSQSTSSGSSVQCPNMGAYAGNGTTAAAATARYSA